MTKSAQVMIVPSTVKGQKLTSLHILDRIIKIPFAGDLFIDENGSFYEVVRCKDRGDFRSWFCGKLVVRDGSFLMLTQIDSLFLAIPFFLAKRNVYSCLFDLLPQGSSFKQIFESLNKDTVNLEMIADKKTACGETLYRFSEQKSIKWLKCKMMNIIAAIKKIGINVCPTKVSVKEYQSGRKDDVDIKHYQRYALDFLKNYVPSELVEILHQDLNLDEKDDSMMEVECPMKEEELGPKGEKRPLDDSDCPEYEVGSNGIALKKEGEIKKNKQISSTQAQLAREAQKHDQPSIRSFFKAQPKIPIKKE